MRTEQNAVGVVQGQKCADREFARRKRFIEPGIAEQLTLCGELRYLPAHAAFGAHLPAVERIQCLRIAAARLIPATETAKTTPALGRCTTPAKSDPAQLHRREPVVRVVLQLRYRAAGRCTEFERVGAVRGRIVQHGGERCAALVCVPVGRKRQLQIAGGLRLCKRATRARLARCSTGALTAAR